jgi:phosphoribosylanthranilate isomerase
MIFYDQSPRFLTLDAAKAISRVVPSDCLKVGVFVNEERDRILELVRSVPLDLVQLHGEESEGDISTLRHAGVKVIKGFSISAAADFVAVAASSADYVLIDNQAGDDRGGTGTTFDWTLAQFQPIANLVLAGGINHENVAAGVARFQPAIVDVNSGLESKPGIKSVEKMKQFFEECDRIRHGR